MRRQQVNHSTRTQRLLLSILTPSWWFNWGVMIVLVSGPVIFTIGQRAGRTVAADQPAKPHVLPKADKDGWRLLFDGKTLTNWKATNFGGDGDVYVLDGVLGLDMGNPLTGVTWTGADLPKVNYEIELQARKVSGGDFFCALTFPVNDNHQTLVLGGWGGAVIGLSSIDGFDASENETTDYYSFKKEQWYKVRVKVTDKTIQSWIDGESIHKVEYAGKRLSTRIEVDLSKPLGICSFETQGEIRSLRLRTLDGK